MSVAVPSEKKNVNTGAQSWRARGPRFAVGAVGAALLLGLGLTACASGTIKPSPSSAPPSPSAIAPAAAIPEADSGPALLPNGTASDNLEYFNSLATAVTTAASDAGGRAYIDALVAGGFDRSVMQVTFDRTQADLVADSVQFSVNFAGECLIGQIGPASDGFHSVVAPLLSTGLCLVGSTRQIDW